MFEEYKKVIPELVLDSSYKLKYELEAKDKKINDLLAKQNEVSVLKSQMSEIQEHIKNLKTSF